jgi:monoterpene epsilon-lactone hydrolase
MSMLLYKEAFKYSSTPCSFNRNDFIMKTLKIKYERETYQTALDEVERGLLIDSDHPQLLCMRGLIEKATQENKRAYQTFTLAIEHDPSLLEAWANRAIIAYEMGQLDAAIADLTQALSLEENATLLSNRALAYQAQQQWDDAITDYTRCLALTEDNPEQQQELFYQRALCYFHAGYKKQAAKDIKAHLAIGISPYLDDKTAEDIKGTESQLPWIQQSIQQALRAIQQPSSILTIDSYRAAFDAVSALHIQPSNITINEFQINGLSAEWLLPNASIPERVILYFHSGTYLNGSLQTDRALASMLAHITQTKVLQIAYRIAPEHPFPTAAYDGFAAYQWLLAHGHEPQHIALAGSAAGGGITLAVLLLARDQSIPFPVVAACLSPWVDLTAEGLVARSHMTTDVVLSTSLLEYAARQYVSPEDASLPLASPLYADLHGLPPLFLQVGENEILHDDVYRLAKRAEACHVKAPCITWADMFHGWHAFSDRLPFGQLALEQIAAYFEKYFARARGI